LLELPGKPSQPEAHALTFLECLIRLCLPIYNRALPVGEEPRSPTGYVMAVSKSRNRN
jgi:hypothetical protein